MKNVQKTNTASSSKRISFAAEAFEKTKKLVLNRNRNLKWSERADGIVKMLEEAQEKSHHGTLRGIVSALLGRGFLLIFFRENHQKAIMAALPKIEDMDHFFRLTSLKSLHEAATVAKKLDLIESDETLTAAQADRLRKNYGVQTPKNSSEAGGAKDLRDRVAAALRGLSFEKKEKGRAGNRKLAQPLPMAVVEANFLNALPGVDYAAAQKATRAIARGDQQKELPHKAAMLVTFWDAAEQRRQESMDALKS